MPIKKLVDAPSYKELKRDEVFWEGKQYELTFKTNPGFDSIKKRADDELIRIRQQIETLYPRSIKMDAINGWLTEQATLLAVAFWNDVKENEEHYLFNSAINHTPFYIYDIDEEDPSQKLYSKHPTGGFAIWEGPPWIKEFNARVVTQTVDAPIIDAKNLYHITSKKGELPTFEYTQFHGEYSWLFASHLYRALRRNNDLYRDTFKVISDRMSFQLETI